MHLTTLSVQAAMGMAHQGMAHQYCTLNVNLSIWAYQATGALQRVGHRTSVAQRVSTIATGCITISQMYIAF